MKIKSIDSLKISDVKILRYEKFFDNRGYFTEPYRFSQFAELNFINQPFVQMNESFSLKGVLRGLHFQWNPLMGKLVRTISGHMMDFVLDVRLNSPSFSKIIAFDMPANDEDDAWIWVPPGFAHGNYFLEESKIEYLCTGEYNPNCEAGINPFSSDIDWSWCDKKLYQNFLKLKDEAIVSEKDKLGLTINQWRNDERSKNIRYLN